MGAYPFNIVPDIICSCAYSPEVYTFFPTPRAYVICVIRSRKNTSLRLCQVDVQTKHARNEKHFNNTKHYIIKRRTRAIIPRAQALQTSSKTNAREYATAKLETLATAYRLKMMPVLEVIQTLQTFRYNQTRNVTSSKHIFFATFPLSRLASIRIHVEVPNG